MHLSMYLKQIAAYPLLSRKDELQLAKKNQRDESEALQICLKRNMQFNELSPSAEYEKQQALLCKYRAGNRLKNKSYYQQPASGGFYS